MMAQPAKKDKKLTIAQAAQRLSCHPATVRRYILAGRLRALQYSKFGTIRITEAEIDRFLSECKYTEPLA
jgi:excisionase family DNA binding protein